MSKKLFNIFKSLSVYRLEQLSDALDIIESGLDGKFEEWGSWFDEQTQGLSDDDKELFVNHYYDDLAMIRDTAPNMARKAMFICIVGFLETFMADLCRFLARDNNLQQPKQKLYLEASKKYLIETANVNEDCFDGQEWLSYFEATCVRNIIVHCAGKIPVSVQGNLADQLQTATSFIGQTDSIEIDSLNKIIIDRGFCEGIATKVEQCMTNLLDGAENCYYP